jgi:hypothetical protein
MVSLQTPISKQVSTFIGATQWEINNDLPIFLQPVKSPVSKNVVVFLNSIFVDATLAKMI